MTSPTVVRVDGESMIVQPIDGGYRVLRSHSEHYVNPDDAHQLCDCKAGCYETGTCKHQRAVIAFLKGTAGLLLLLLVGCAAPSEPQRLCFISDTTQTVVGQHPAVYIREVCTP
jgi:hypothetical protein